MPRGQLPKRVYLAISQGKITQRLEKLTKRKEEINLDAVKKKYPQCNSIREIINDEKFDKTVLERVDDYVEGIIVGITIESSDFGDQLRIEMEDGVESFNLQLGLKTSYGISFMKVDPNIDPLSVVRIRPWRNVKNKSQGLIVSQGGIRVENFWNKDNPGDYPVPPDFVGKKPYHEWEPTDKSKYEIFKVSRNVFLQEYLMKNVAPKFKAENQPVPEPEERGGLKETPVSDLYEDEKQEEKEIADPADDLPF